MKASKTLRRDARDNASKLRAAALDLFLTQGLDAPLNEIARVAGVSVGTLFNRFGSREGLIDAVIPDVAARRLQDLGIAVIAEQTPRKRLEAFVRGMIDLQRDDPALLGVCDRSTALGQDLVREAHADGSLSLDFTEDDLFSLLWLAGTASRAESAPAGWVRIINRTLESAWTD
jgi:AcrR family transcriptional regulator